MKNKLLSCIFTLLSVLFVISVSFASETKDSLTISELMKGIAEYEKQEVTLVGTIAGACNSGCKIWVSDGPYKKGEPVALVWAKDTAFTFKTDTTGQKVLLKGYAVGKYIDLCGLEKGATGTEKKDASGCNPIVETETGKKQLSSVTFFATSVDYL